MVGRYYTVSFENVAVAAAQDLFEFGPADDRPICLLGLTLDNVGGTADAGDVNEQLLRMSIVRGHATSGSGGTTATPRPMDSFNAAASFTSEVNNTTIASAGTAVTMAALGWNVRVPLREFWPEELAIWAGQTDALLVVRLLAAPTGTVQVSGTAYLIEG